MTRVSPRARPAAASRLRMSCAGDGVLVVGAVGGVAAAHGEIGSGGEEVVALWADVPVDD